MGCKLLLAKLPCSPPTRNPQGRGSYTHMPRRARPEPAQAVHRPTYVVTLRPEKAVLDPVRALRNALKDLLRKHGLRAVAVAERGAP
jgi:hypothetical protein